MPTDYSDAISQVINTGPRIAVGHIDDNPDDAARAIQLGDATGVPASSVALDLNGFEAQHKAELAGRIVRGNPQLAAYVQSHPLAASVSNDDYGAMDQFSRGATQTSGLLDMLKRGVVGATEGFKEGFGNQPLGQQFGAPQSAAGTALNSMGWVPLDFAARSLSAIAGAASGGAGGLATGAYKTVTGDEAGAQSFGRDIQAMTEYEMQKGEMASHPVVQAAHAAEPWLREGMEPPTGAHPVLDKAKADTNAQALDQLNNDLDNAQQSQTKVRAPQLFDNFVKQHYGDAEIGIHGDAATALYGEKAPAPDDGLLGWVPGIEDKLALARETGADVSIPAADWISKADPKIAANLHDDIRMWPGGITAREAGDLEDKGLASAIDSPMAQTRAQGLEPLFSIGDRRISLKQEQDAITKYSGSHALAGNTLLREGEEAFNNEYSYMGPRFRGQVQKTIDTMDGMGKPLAQDTVLYRGMPIDDGVKVGDDLIDPGFSSTSRTEGTPRGYADSLGHRLVEIHASKGSSVVDFADRGQEKGEVVLPRENKLRVREVRGDRVVADLLGPDALASIGDRKATLKRSADIPGFEEFHNYQMLDEQGKPVGEIEIVPDAGKKQLYVANISGLNGMYSNSFGPSLVRDLKRQLKTLYPDYETITGHRVSGAREAAGVEDGKPVVQLSVHDDVADHQNFNDIIQGAQWQSVHPQIDAAFPDYYTEHESALNQAVHEELSRMTGGKVEAYGALGINNKALPGKTVDGVFLQYPDRAPMIIYSLDAPDTAGVARHEGIHFLRQYGFFSGDEWKTLSDAAKAEDWQGRYGISDRYSHISDAARNEESIAEAYREWATSEAKNDAAPVSGIFAKLKEFLDNLKSKFRQITGQENVDDIFAKARSGEIAGREANPGDGRGALASIRDDDQASVKDQLDQLKAGNLGLNVKTWKNLQRLVEARYEEDIAAATRRAEKEQAKTQTKEWKDNARAMRQEVEQTIRQRPDVAADLLLSKGELYGEQVEARPTLLSSELSTDQKAALPRRYYSEQGIPADAIANLLGYQSGDQMLERLSAYTQLKGDLSAEDMVKKVVDDETQRRMEAQHGQLSQNIMQEARDTALSQTNLDLMAEELKAAGEMAKTETIDKKALQSWVKGEAAKQTIGSVSSDRWMNLIGRHGKDAEQALINSDPAKAVVSLQRKYVAGLFAAESRKLEKEVAAFDRQAKSLSKRVVPALPQEYTNFVHQILVQVGKPVRRSVQDIANEVGAGANKDLGAFVEDKKAGLREIPVWDQLLDKSWKKDYASLTAEEFRNIRDSIKTMVHNGREEQKIYRAGDAADYADIKAKMIEGLKQFEPIQYDAAGKRSLGVLPQKGADLLRQYGAMHTQLETLINRWDKENPQGPWNQYVMRDLIASEGFETAMKKEFAKRIVALDDKADLNRQVENSIFKPTMGVQVPVKMTRKNLRAVMLNTGNDSNLVKMARGYELQPKDVMDWVHKHATKEDWDFVQKVWDSVFAELKDRSDTMYRSLSGGVAPEAIQIRPVDTAFGKYEGGYYPIIYHPEFEGASKKLMGPNILEGEGYIRASTPAGYTKSRTGYVAPMSLDLDAMPGRIAQMIHDINMRPAIINAAKVFYDKDVRGAVAGHYGTEYRDLMIPYLKDVANNSNYMSKAQRTASAAGEFFRQNVIGTLVGLNPGTVLKHMPTAFIQSMNEVGSARFLKATRGMFSLDEETGERNWQFAIGNSVELQRRHQNYEETISGAVQGLVPTSKFDSLRQTVLKYGSYPIAMSDLLSAVPAWLAKYDEASGRGLPHGDAVYEADRAVRRAHGSTAATNRPAVVRNSSPWLTSVYTFFNHILNRQMEMVWKAGEVRGMVKEGQYKTAMAEVPKLAGMMWAYAIAPAVIEHLVAGTPDTPEERKKGWARKAVEAEVQFLGGSWVGVRDITSALVSGRDPTAGLLGTGMKMFTQFHRDLDKNDPLSKDHAGRLIQDAATMVGAATGLVQEQVGRTARFAYGVGEGLEQPKGPWGWVVGARFGTLKNHSQTLNQYLGGRQ